MRFLAPVTVGLVSLFFSPVLAQYTDPSAPFNLVLLSSTNTTLNGSSLAACHTGAAIESLCVTGGAVSPGSDTFTLNTSASAPSPPPAIGNPGYLIYVLQGSNFNESEPLSLYIDPASNVALPLFEPGVESTTYAVAFDEKGLLNIQSYVDDTTSPPTLQTKAYYRWYACQTYFLGYQYLNLAFVLGEAEPQNPTCQKVDVTRVFV
ncbi:MAG: hypothetical protein Q9227_000185 [Pyrenula ochraceoflavens]